MDELLFSDELMKLTRWSRATLYRQVKLGAIPVTRIGGVLRFRRRDIEEWIEAATTKPNMVSVGNSWPRGTGAGAA
jgi:excisionase family DNA binding protein